MLAVKRTATVLASIVFIALCVPRSDAQTQAQLEQKYPKLNAYLVRPNILLTAKYASDGQVCEMVLEPRRWTEKEIVLVSTLSEEETIGVVEEVVPESERGNRLTNPLPSTVAGGSITTTYDYEHISVCFFGSAREKGAADMVAVVTWRKRSCD